MPQVANIVINDGAASPVAFTYVPLGRDDKNVWWFEQATPAPANALGANRIGISVQRATNNGKLTGDAKVIITTYEPVLETLGTNAAGIVPPPTVAYRRATREEIILSERSTKQERKDTRIRLRNLLDNALVVAAIDDLQPFYG